MKTIVAKALYMGFCFFIGAVLVDGLIWHKWRDGLLIGCGGAITMAIIALITVLFRQRKQAN